MKRRGTTLIELMVGLAVLTAIFGGIFTAFMALNGAQTFSVTAPTVQESARQMTLTVAAALRRASLCTASDTGCTLNAGIESASASGLTVYGRDGNGALVKTTYSTSSGDFQRTANGTTTTIYPNASLNMTYYQSATYHAGALAAFPPTSATAPSLVAVQIQGTVTSGNMSSTYSTIVRLRNGPLKQKPTD